MKNLKTFEALNNPIVTDHDIELIENCFLDYIDQNICLLYTRKHRNVQGVQDPVFVESPNPDCILVSIYIPKETKNEIHEEFPEDEEAQYRHNKQKEWLVNLRKNLGVNIKRCEIYGFELVYESIMFCASLHLYFKKIRPEKFNENSRFVEWYDGEEITLRQLVGDIKQYVKGDPFGLNLQRTEDTRHYRLHEIYSEIYTNDLIEFSKGCLVWKLMLEGDGHDRGHHPGDPGSPADQLRLAEPFIRESLDKKFTVRMLQDEIKNSGMFSLKHGCVAGLESLETGKIEFVFVFEGKKPLAIDKVLYLVIVPGRFSSAVVQWGTLKVEGGFGEISWILNENQHESYVRWRIHSSRTWRPYYR